MKLIGLTGVAAVSTVSCLLLAVHAVAAPFSYQENFDGLSVGQTQPFPGDPGQGGWFSAFAQGSAFGEVQSTVANTGQALHEFTAATNPNRQQTIDRRNFSPVDVNGLPLVTLSFDFYAHTSDLNAVNNFIANMTGFGGPGGPFSIVDVNLGGGNGTPKAVTGVSVNMGAFNGVNNDRIPLAVGQHLAFDTWHSVSVSLDQLQDRYISITVDGNTEDLSAFILARDFPGGIPTRGNLLDHLQAQVVPDDVGGVRTDDDVYWDNLSLTAVPEPSTIVLALCAGLACFAWRFRTLLTGTRIADMCLPCSAVFGQGFLNVAAGVTS